MHAEPGDWIVVHGHTDHDGVRRGLVLEVHGADGAPPYVVRWTEDDHEGLVFPGPDATVVCCAHEYTEVNCAFAQTVEPGNPALRSRIQEVRALRARGRPSLPTSIGEERAFNPFLRVDADEVVAWAEREHGIARDDRVARFAALRSAKDCFKAPSTW